MRVLLIILSYAAVFGAGFAAGVFALPLLIAPPAPNEAAVLQDRELALFTGEFVRDLQDSDLLHWGEGRVFVHRDRVSFSGRLAPGPDYRLYFSPEFVETEADFLRLRDTMREAGPVRTFQNFVVPLPRDLDPARYAAVIVWCESFGEFITAASYR